MKIEFDPRKDAVNRRKHGISLALAEHLDWVNELAWIERRFPYDECRMSALVPFKERVYFVAYVDRGTCRRIISLRKADNKERRTYDRLSYY
ncbi:BrnT family toxin [Pseudoduganella sp.]|uniref:BrnT family toxin n=1 Tax=Pseudoduganella sp. TaxID=1880898 RepID=UPI0035B2C16E